MSARRRLVVRQASFKTVFETFSLGSEAEKPAYLQVPHGHLYCALLRPCYSAGTWLRWATNPRDVLGLKCHETTARAARLEDSCDAKVDRVLCASRRAGISARCCLSCCHTSSGEGADGFRTHRSVVELEREIEVFHSIETMLRKLREVGAERNQESYWYKEVRPKV